jgi:hypothetical protein
MAKSTARKAPWKRSNPRKSAGKTSKHLTPAKKAKAKARAKRAGRPYPNLVDNMSVAKSAKKKSTKKTTKKTASKSAKKTNKTTTKKTTNKTASKKSARKTAKKASRKKASKKKAAKKVAVPKAEKDPKGGLTAKGREAFAKRDGAHLKPGVTKKTSEMTPTDMRRKGSWAVRFYGRAKLPPLVDQEGRPTRHALSAHAWGEPVPKTVAAARKIAAKGERLLDRYHKLKKDA